MQWDATPNAGFTTATKPWMRVHDNHKQVNAASQVDDPKSIYRLWREVLQKRKANKAVFVYGDFELVDEANDKVFAYKRTAANGEVALVVCNFSAETVKWSFDGKAKEVVVTPTDKTLDQVNGGAIELGPYEAIGLLL